MAHQLVWLITGATSGIGRDLALEILARGDKVIATGRTRSFEKLHDLREKGADPLELDVTWPLERLREVAKTAVGIYGRIDVVVNNAGYSLVGPLEETTPEDTQKMFDTNLFGALNISRAFLPYLREKRSGTFVFVGSMNGWRPNPYNSMYGATKWALRCASSSLHQEVAPFGLRSTCVDFGYFRTAILEDGRFAWASESGTITDYKEIDKALVDGIPAVNGTQANDPRKAAKIVVDLVKGEGVAVGKENTFPLYLTLGADCYESSKDATQTALGLLEEWKDVTCSTAFDTKV